MKNVYACVWVGLFEWMYGAVGGEVPYRTFDSRFAVGLDVNWVAARFQYAVRFPPIDSRRRPDARHYPTAL